MGNAKVAPQSAIKRNGTANHDQRPVMSKDWAKLRRDTILTAAGRDPAANHGIVNPPVYHASTILFPTLADLERAEKGQFTGPVYGRHGTPTTFALEEAVAALEGSDQAVILPSGMAAIAAVLFSFVSTGDHVLVTDNAYGPARRFCNQMLKRLGVETSYFDPMIGAGIAELIRPNTKIILCESPGSLTFEVQDIPAIVAAAHPKGVKVALDNTWATPIYFDAMAHGVDISLAAGTKYLVGHSDAMIGTVAMREADAARIRKTIADIGYSTAPDDCYLALRGLRTLSVRLARHQETGLKLAKFLGTRPEVDRVLHPALPGTHGHEIWQRDFTGASGLFAFTLKQFSRDQLANMVDHMALFGMGYSWGGYESLLLPVFPGSIRTAVPWTVPGPLLRVHAGLEDADDLIADLAAGLDRLAAL